MESLGRLHYVWSMQRGSAEIFLAIGLILIGILDAFKELPRMHELMRILNSCIRGNSSYRILSGSKRARLIFPNFFGVMVLVLYFSGSVDINVSFVTRTSCQVLSMRE